MTIYLLYFSLILIVPSICSSLYRDRQIAQTTALRILMMLMYLILALKSETVGCDTAGYKKIYEYTKSLPFNDFSYTYMENGYLLLMKVFNLMGCSFQVFSAFLYIIVVIPLYKLIKKYSPDVMISILVLFCLDYFVFACSGLRQTVAMSLCVWAFLVLKKTDKKREFIISILIVIAADFIHRSALLFIPVLFIIFFQYNAFTYIIYAIVLAVFVLNNNFAMTLNQQYELSHYEVDERLTLGLMFVFDTIMFVFYVISIRIHRAQTQKEKLYWQLGNIVVYGLILMVGFNGAMLLRSAAYELLFLSILMPVALSYWPRETRRVISVIYIFVLLYCLYFLVLEPSTLRIVPYKFFFQN